MAALVPCSACRRHLRQQETQCPFCRAQQPPPAAQRKQIAIPRDASRATIFALGLTLAGQGCGASANTATENDNQGGFTSIVPPYGAVTCADNPLRVGCQTPLPCEPPLDCGASGGSGGTGNGLTGSGGSDGTAGNAGRSDAGAVFDAGAEDAGVDAGAEDAGVDAATNDAGN